LHLHPGSYHPPAPAVQLCLLPSRPLHVHQLLLRLQEAYQALLLRLVLPGLTHPVTYHCLQQAAAGPALSAPLVASPAHVQQLSPGCRPRHLCSHWQPPAHVHSDCCCCCCCCCCRQVLRAQAPLPTIAHWVPVLAGRGGARHTAHCCGTGCLHQVPPPAAGLE
jgi:hypothetical protein